jgi:DNA primase catalytic subunit
MKHLTPLLDAEKNNSSSISLKSVMTIKRPKKEFLKEVMRELRATTYTDKAVKITESATLHFEKPVEIAMFTDYRQFVETPMDLETVDRKIESGACKFLVTCIPSVV